ncbi:hypothetical protein ABT186_01925 [Streptomyces sp. NPDC001634]|uniref:hypothetical protein n=1 Tax=Streptomyces sp. NPDC001634 TaxID=3154390 RepID=UPI00332BF1CA
MAGQCWQPGDWKKFEKQAEFGKPYYVVRDQATNLAPYEDKQLYAVHVFTERAPITGHKSTAGGTTAGALCRNQGPVYDAPPRGMRNIADRAPQVAGPLGSNDYEGVLDEAELRGLEKQVAQGSNPRTRRRIGGWRV